MIALTESRKLELIEECKKVMDESSPDGDIYPIYAIALESLTAVPTYSRYRLSAKGSGPDAEKSPWFAGDGKALRESHDVEVGNLFTAPPVPEIKLSLLQPRDLEALIRFNETCEDGEGYDLSKDKMDRLVELGVVRKIRGSIREITSLGQMYIDINCQDSPSEFLMTETDRAAAFNQHIKRLNGLGE